MSQVKTVDMVITSWLGCQGSFLDRGSADRLVVQPASYPNINRYQGSFYGIKVVEAETDAHPQLIHV